MPSIDTLIASAGRWFLHSGIQEPNGGVARYYRSDLAKNATVSTEITGYAVSAFLFLHHRTGELEYLDRALRAGRFLTRTAWDGTLGTFPFEHGLNGHQPGAFAYFFDCGIIVRGLLAVWRTTGEAEFRDGAIAAGRGMLADFFSHETIHPILALPGKTPLPYQDRWSASPGCYQLKSAMAWFDLFECTGEAEFLRAYERALDAALANDSSFLPGDPNCEKVMDRLHAYAYFLEGLLPVIDRAECARAYRQGLDRMAGYLREIAPQFARSDVYAQLLRARLFAVSVGLAGLDCEAAAEEAAQAATFQLHSEDSRIAGGFGFGCKMGQQLPYVNPVSTAFAVQALALWSDHRNHALQASRQALI